MYSRSCLVSAYFSFCFGLGSWVQIPPSALRASWCFVLVVFLLVFFGGFAFVLGCTRTPNRVNALRSSLVVLGSTPGSLFGVLVLFFFFFFFWFCVLLFCLFVLVLGSNPAQCASWCLDQQPEINLRSGCDQPATPLWEPLRNSCGTPAEPASEPAAEPVAGPALAGSVQHTNGSQLQLPYLTASRRSR